MEYLRLAAETYVTANHWRSPLPVFETTIFGWHSPLWSNKGGRRIELLVLMTTHKLCYWKLRHDRFVPRMCVRRSRTSPRENVALRCAIPPKGCLFKRSCSAGEFHRYDSRGCFGGHIWLDRRSEMLFSGIQFVNQSGNPPNSLPRFLREFGSLTGNRFLSLCTRLYCTCSLCGCTLWRGRVGTSFDSSLNSFTREYAVFCITSTSIITPRALGDTG